MRQDIARHGRSAEPLMIVAFVAAYALATVGWHVPHAFAGLYIGASIVCYLVYAADKSAAVAGRRRIPESTLLFLGLVGGWPGAIMAQQLLRHKSRKTSFRAKFFFSVLVNVTAFFAINALMFR